MCTVVTLVKDSLFFGRNMDIDFDFGQSIAVMPREYALDTKLSGTLLKHYAVIGSARVEDGYPLYAEACNEKGLCMAGLNFPGNAVYAECADDGKIALTPYEFIPYVLGKCACLGEAVKLIEKTEIVAIRFKEELPLAPLHWIVADKSGSVVVERTAEGIKIFENPAGVLTNNPPFPLHLKNLEKYENLSVRNNKKSNARVGYSTYSEGEGALGLPGDFSSPSRFVKAWFCLKNTSCNGGAASKAAQTFRVLDCVAMVRGTVVTAQGGEDITAYSCCIDAENGTYYYKTYDGLSVKSVQMDEENSCGETLTVVEM